jgi:hypothetical protein
MKRFCLCLIFALSACAEEEVRVSEKTDPSASPEAAFAPYPMQAELGYLSAEEKRVLNKLFEAADLMSAIYQQQLGDPQAHSPGAGFYPTDLSRDEFERWLREQPQDRAAFTSLYTVIERRDNGLVAIPYNRAYRRWLEPAARVLRQAAALTSNRSLARYLELRAQALLDDDYFASDLAWMEIEGTPIDPVIGPYEVYADELFGYKAAYQAAITVQAPGDADKLQRFKGYLREMEAHLPIADQYKNFRRTFQSPVILATMLRTGGFLGEGPQAMAFNLPNDERAREAKGSKNVLLKNVMQAKFNLILAPMADYVLFPRQSRFLGEEVFVYFILFHELSHGLGPGIISKNGEETTSAAELKELFWVLEEAKADLMSVYNLLFMMEKGEFSATERDKLLSTYFVNLFRTMRFGLTDTYSRAAALQYRAILAHGGCRFEPSKRRFTLDFTRLAEAVENLLQQILLLQARGDYPRANQLLQQRAVLDNQAEEVLEGLRALPVDIAPAYPARIE